jgi:hypothetical protein
LKGIWTGFGDGLRINLDVVGFWVDCWMFKGTKLILGDILSRSSGKMHVMHMRNNSSMEQNSVVENF